MGSPRNKRWYRAEAIIRPVGQNAILKQTTGLLSAIGGNAIGDLAAGILGGASGNGADEYMPILTSFTFTNALVKKLGTLFAPLYRYCLQWL